MTRWYEDIVLGEPFPLGSHSFTEDEIVRFGKLYDPQYFHVDAEAAKAARRQAIEDLFWAVLTSNEFLFNH